MKCPKCNTNKKMGSTYIRVDDYKTTDAWICTNCGCGIIKDKEILRMTEQQKYKDLNLIWNTINSPMKAGSKWCTYTRTSINDVLPAIKRIMIDNGFKFSLGCV